MSGSGARFLLIVVSEMDMEDTPLIGRFGYCSQELIGLMLVGRAASNMWDGNKQLGEGADVMHLGGEYMYMYVYVCICMYIYMYMFMLYMQYVCVYAVCVQTMYVYEGMRHGWLDHIYILSANCIHYLLI